MADVDEVDDEGAPFIGATREQLVIELLATFERVRETGYTHCAVLSGSMGLGKTRVIQELYAQIVGNQSSPAYWPRTIVPQQIARDPLRSRNAIYPDGFEQSEAAVPDFLWWGMSAQREDSERWGRALRNGGEQLRVHTAGLLRRVSQRGRAARKGANALLKLVSIVVPDPVTIGLTLKDAAADLQELASDMRTDRRRRAGAPDRLRRIEVDRQAWSPLAQEVAASLEAILGPDLPLVIVVDNAHWLDPGSLDSLDRLVRSDLPLLLIATAWPDETRVQANIEDATERSSTFGGWLSEMLGVLDSRVKVHPLGPLSELDMAALVRNVGPNTDQDIIDQITRLAAGNPLYLHVFLRSPLARSSLRNGALELGLNDLQDLTGELAPLYRDHWDALDEGTQRTLGLAALQGYEFVEPLVLAAAEDAAEARHGLSTAEDRAWISRLAMHLEHFVEPIHLEVARLRGRMSRAREGEALSRAAAEAARMWRADGWDEQPLQLRRRVLETITQSAIPAEHTADEFEATLTLSRLLGAASEWTEADHLVGALLAHGPESSVPQHLRREAAVFAVHSRRACRRYVEAAQLGDELMGTWGDGPVDEEPLRAALWWELARVAVGRGQEERASALFSRARAGYHLIGQLDTAGWIAVELAVVAIDGGRPEDALAVAEEILAEISVGAAGEGLSDLEFHLQTTRCDALAEMGDRAASVAGWRSVRERALEHFGPSSDEHAYTLAALAYELAYSGAVDEVHLLVDQVPGVAPSASTRVRADALTAAAAASVMTGDLLSARRDFAMAGAIYRDLGGDTDPRLLEVRALSSMSEVMFGQATSLSQFTEAVAAGREATGFVGSMYTILADTVSASFGIEVLSPDELLEQFAGVRRARSGGQTLSLLGLIVGMRLVDSGNRALGRQLLDDRSLWRNAGDFDPALRLLQILCAPSVAASAGRHASRIADEVQPTIPRLHGLGIAASVARRCGDAQVELELLEELGRIADEVFGPASLVSLRARLRAARLNQLAGLDDAVRAELDSVWDRLEGAADGAIAAGLRVGVAEQSFHLGDNQTAIERVRAAMSASLEPSDQLDRMVLFSGATLLYQLQEDKDADAIIDRALAGPPDSELRSAHLDLVRSLLDAGSWREAEEALDELEVSGPATDDRDPNAYEILALRARCRRAADDLGAAVRHLTAAVRLLGNAHRADDDRVLQARRELAAALADAGEHAAARDQRRIVYDVFATRLGFDDWRTVEAALELEGTQHVAGLSEDGRSALVELLDLLPADAAQLRVPLLQRLSRRAAEGGRTREAADWNGQSLDALVLAGAGDEHPDVLDARERQARYLSKARGTRDAADLWAKVYDGRAALLGGTERLTVEAAREYANCCYQTGQAVRAVVVLEDLREQLVAEGVDDGRLAQVLGLLASGHRACGDVGSAVDERRQQLRIALRIVSSDVGQVAEITLRLVDDLVASAHHDDAAHEFVELLGRVWNAPSPKAAERIQGYLSKAGRRDSNRPFLLALDSAIKPNSDTRADVDKQLALSLERAGDLTGALRSSENEIRVRTARGDEQPHLLVDARARAARLRVRLGEGSTAVSAWIDAIDGQLAPRAAERNGRMHATLSQARSLAAAHPLASLAVLAHLEQRLRPGWDADRPTVLRAIGETYLVLGRVQDAVDTTVRAFARIGREPARQMVDQARWLFERLIERSAWETISSFTERLVAAIGDEPLPTECSTDLISISRQLLEVDRPALAEAVLTPVTGAIAYPRALAWLAEARRKQGNHQGAITAITEEVELRARSGDSADGVLEARGRLASVVSMIDRAQALALRRDTFVQATTIDPPQPEVLDRACRQLTDHLLEDGAVDRACETSAAWADAVVRRSGSDSADAIDARQRHGRFLCKVGRDAEAVVVFEVNRSVIDPPQAATKALALTSDWLALAYENLGRAEEAVAARQADLDLRHREHPDDPDHPDVTAALDRLAALFSRLGRYGDACDTHAQQAKAFVRSNGSESAEAMGARQRHGQCLCEAGRFGEAISVLEVNLAIVDPPEAATKSLALTNDWLALAYENLGRAEEAVAARQADLDLRHREHPDDPDHPDVTAALDRLAQLLRRIGRHHDAHDAHTAFVEAVIRRTGPNSAEAIEARLVLGWGLCLAGRDAESVVVLEVNLAVVDPPEDAVAWLALTNDWLALAYENLGRAEEAVAARQADRDLRHRQYPDDPEHPDVTAALDRLAQLLQRLGRGGTELESGSTH